MKRSPELTPLSHDHHGALFVAMGLKRAEDRAAAAAFLDFLDGNGEHHFRLEESILLPAWLAAVPDADAAMADRVLAEHLQMRTEAERLRADAHSIEELRALGDLLERHVRFEERELFPRIEADLDAESIAALGARLAAAEHQGSAT